MIEILITIVALIIFIIYFNYSINLVDKISETILFDQLSLWKVISNLGLFDRITLILGMPVILPFGLVVSIINLAFNLKIRK